MDKKSNIMTKQTEHEKFMLEEYLQYREQEEQLIILEEIRQYISELEGYEYEYC